MTGWPDVEHDLPVAPEPNYCVEWFCGGCGRRVDGPMAEDKSSRWCADCGAAYRTSFGRLAA